MSLCLSPLVPQCSGRTGTQHPPKFSKSMFFHIFLLVPPTQIDTHLWPHSPTPLFPTPIYWWKDLAGILSDTSRAWLPFPALSKISPHSPTPMVLCPQWTPQDFLKVWRRCAESPRVRGPVMRDDNRGRIWPSRGPTWELSGQTQTVGEWVSFPAYPCKWGRG